MNYNIQRIKKLEEYLIPMAEMFYRWNMGKPEQMAYKLKLDELRLEKEERLEFVLNRRRG